jgi:hypothetical protein
MDRKILMTVAVVLLAALVVAGIGTAAYRAGVAQGLADAGRLPSGSAMPYAYGPFWHHGPFGFGFFLFPLLGLVLFFALLRGLFWGSWCGGPHRMSLEEWHRRAHEASPDRGEKA